MAVMSLKGKSPNVIKTCSNIRIPTTPKNIPQFKTNAIFLSITKLTLSFPALDNRRYFRIAMTTQAMIFIKDAAVQLRNTKVKLMRHDITSKYIKQVVTNDVIENTVETIKLLNNTAKIGCDISIPR